MLKQWSVHALVGYLIGPGLFRSMLASSLAIMGLYRLLAPGLPTGLPRVFWGSLLLASSGLLVGTSFQRSRWRWGRLAALTACVVLGGLGLDLLTTVGPGTSSLLPVLWAAGALAEGLGHHDC